MEINSFDDTAYQVFYKRVLNKCLKLGIDSFDSFISNNPLIIQQQQQQQQQQYNNNNNNSYSYNLNTTKTTTTTSNTTTTTTNSNSNVIFDRGGVIEINGSSGTGKTECALHIVAHSILPACWTVGNTDISVKLNGNEIGVVYFDNDYKLDILRLRNIIRLKFNHALSLLKLHIAEKQQDLTSDELFVHSLTVNMDGRDSSNENGTTNCLDLFDQLFGECLSRLYIYKCKDSIQFISTLNALPHLIKSVGKEVRDGSTKREIQLVVLDSVSSFYWLDKQGEAMGSRLGQLVGLDLFFQTIGQYQLTVIGIKQSLFKDGTTGASNYNNYNNKAIPKNDFLGPQWSRLVKYRIKFESKYNIDNIFNINNQPQLEFKSPNLTITRV